MDFLTKADFVLEKRKELVPSSGGNQSIYALFFDPSEFETQPEIIYRAN